MPDPTLGLLVLWAAQGLEGGKSMRQGPGGEVGVAGCSWAKRTKRTTSQRDRRLGILAALDPDTFLCTAQPRKTGQ